MVPSGAVGGKMWSDNGENLDEDDAEPESRERIEDERPACEHVVVDPVTADGLQDPERDGHHDGHEGGQGEKDYGLREPLVEQQSRRTRSGCKKSPGCRGQYGPRKIELVPDRAVQPLQLVEGGYCGWLRLDAEFRPGRVPGQQVEHDEHDDGDKQQHDDRLAPAFSERNRSFMGSPNRACRNRGWPPTRPRRS